MYALVSSEFQLCRGSKVNFIGNHIPVHTRRWMQMYCVHNTVWLGWGYNSKRKPYSVIEASDMVPGCRVASTYGPAYKRWGNFFLVSFGSFQIKTWLVEMENRSYILPKKDKPCLLESFQAKEGLWIVTEKSWMKELFDSQFVLNSSDTSLLHGSHSLALICCHGHVWV